MIKKVALVQPLQRVHVFMRVVVYGSANKDTPQVFKDASFELAKLLAQRGHICVNGGGNTGCMGSLSDRCL
jgi:predicted Rossmann-fold nucleotide-binding protein